MNIYRHLRTAMLPAAMLAGLFTVTTGAQPGREHGQSITPVYEGYVEKADGSYDLLFGYLNRNWVEQPVVEVGPDNHMEPDGPDLGQPTHFLPRRNRFVFRVPVPADFGESEVVWTVTANGATAQAFGTLRQGYAVDDTVLMANFGGGGPSGFSPDTVGNIPPVLAVESGRMLTAAVGEAVTLRAVATDDGKPTPRGLPSFWVGRSRSSPIAATGLRLSWFRYRGPGTGHVRPAADESVGGPSRRRRIALVGRLGSAADSAGQPLDRAGYVQRARHLRAALPGPRRGDSRRTRTLLSS